VIAIFVSDHNLIN